MSTVIQRKISVFSSHRRPAILTGKISLPSEIAGKIQLDIAGKLRFTIGDRRKLSFSRPFSRKRPETQPIFNETIGQWVFSS